MRLLIDLRRSPDGRLEGVLYAPDAGGVPFAGVLDLLRVLEEIDLDRPSGSGGDPTDGRDASG